MFCVQFNCKSGGKKGEAKRNFSLMQEELANVYSIFPYSSEVGTVKELLFCFSLFLTKLPAVRKATSMTAA